MLITSPKEAKLPQSPQLSKLPQPPRKRQEEAAPKQDPARSIYADAFHKDAAEHERGRELPEKGETESRRFWNTRLRNIQPYVPGEQPTDRSYIKLNTNEAPFPPSPRVRERLRNFRVDELGLYPDPNSLRLRTALAAYHGLRRENVFVGNGSDEILAFAFQAFFERCEDLGLDQRNRRLLGDESRAQPPAKSQLSLSDAVLGGHEVLTPALGYSFYGVYADFYDIPLRRIPLREDFRVEVRDYDRPSGAVILANPNAPTGLALSRKELRRLLDQDPDRLVIVDEAYVDFASEACSALPLLDSYENLLLIRTFSKSRALAGLRLGFALGPPGLIRALETVRDCFNSYTVDRLAAELGEASLADELYFARCCEDLRQIRDASIDYLRSWGYRVMKSEANFIWLAHPRLSGQALFARLREAGILSRYFDQEGCRDFIRLSVGDEGQMASCLNLLQALMDDARDEADGAASGSVAAPPMEEGIS